MLFTPVIRDHVELLNGTGVLLFLSLHSDMTEYNPSSIQGHGLPPGATLLHYHAVNIATFHRQARRLGHDNGA